MEEEVVVGCGGCVEGEDASPHPPTSPENDPDPTRVSLYKASLAAICAFVTVVILPKFPISYLTGG